MKGVFLCFFTILYSSISLYAQDFDSHLWKHRVLIINSDVLNPNEFEKQLESFRKNRKELNERKLIIYQIKNNKYKLGLGKDEHWKPFKAAFINQWKEFKQAGVTLIGLDGSVKLQFKNSITLKELFDTIDAMPMRRYELSSKSKG